MALRISKSFKDISLSFSRHPVTNDITILKNENAITKSVTNLVRTQIGERFFNSLLGSSVTKSLFELSTTEISLFLEQEIENLLKNFEPRIKLSDITVNSEIDQNTLDISITYEIIGQPFPTQTVEFILQPTRV